MKIYKPRFLQLAYQVINYNLKIVFGGKFIYFLSAALAFYFIFTGVMLFSDSTQDNSGIFNFLIFPGFLTAFYPVIYNIQNDKDARMLEIIFSIPDYRYKVFLVRFVIALGVMTFALFFMAGFTWFAVLRVPVVPLVYHLMFPLVFLACFAFLVSTLTKNGNAAAAIIVIIGLFFFLLNEPLRTSKWYLFLNPFYQPQMSEAVWVSIIRQNRIILSVGSAVSLLWAFFNLQRREKYL